MRTLLAGGPGCVGPHLCERLVLEVVALANFGSGRTNVASLLGNARFEHIRHDMAVRFSTEAGSLPNPAGPRHGTPGEPTMLETAEEVIRLTSTRTKATHMPLWSGDPKQHRADIGRARSLFGLEPKPRVRDDLVRTIEDFRSRMP